MPQDPKAASGSFSDLYEAMQTRSTPKPPAIPVSAPELPTPRNRGKAEPRNHASAEPKIRGTAEPRTGMDTSSTPAKPEEFNLAEKPYKPHGFLWTKEELWALDDIKKEFARQYDVETSLQELIRCALHMLVEDYRSHGEQSSAVKRVVKKKR